MHRRCCRQCTYPRHSHCRQSGCGRLGTRPQHRKHFVMLLRVSRVESGRNKFRNEEKQSPPLSCNRLKTVFASTLSFLHSREWQWHAVRVEQCQVGLIWTTAAYLWRTWWDSLAFAKNSKEKYLKWWDDSNRLRSWGQLIALRMNVFWESKCVAVLSQRCLPVASSRNGCLVSCGMSLDSKWKQRAYFYFFYLIQKFILVHSSGATNRLPVNTDFGIQKQISNIYTIDNLTLRTNLRIKRPASVSQSYQRIEILQNYVDK